MGKLANYIGIMSGSILLFYIFGFLDGTPSSTFLNLLLDPVNFQFNSEIVAKLLILVGSAIGITIVSAFTGGNKSSDFLAMTPMVTLLLSFLWDFIIIVSLFYAVSPTFTVLVFSTFLILYVLTVI